MANITPEPDDILGTRPASEGPQNAWSLLRQMGRLLRRHGIRLCALALVLMLVLLAGTMILAVLVAVCDRLGLKVAFLWLHLWPVLSILAAAIAGPLDGGYWLAVQRLLDGEKAGVRTLFAGYRQVRLFLNLTVVSAIVFGVSTAALAWVWARLPWDFCWQYFDNFVDPASPIARLIWSIPHMNWFLSTFHVCMRMLLLLPIQWALAEVVISRKTWTRALVGSVRLALRYRGPALLAFAVMAVLTATDWLRWQLPLEQDYSGFARSAISCINLIGNGTITLATAVIQATAFVVVYREFVRRDREAQGPPLDSPAPVP